MSDNVTACVETPAQRPFHSIRFYVALVFTCLPSVSLWLIQDNFRAIFEDFELDLSQFTQFFLRRQAVYLTLLVPKAVILKELLATPDALRKQFDIALSVLGLFTLIIIGVALLGPLNDLMKGLSR
jgi:hypothetical protein